MRLLFAHDHRFIRGETGGIYSSGSFPAIVWDRFLDHFEHVHVIARDGGTVADVGALAPASREMVSFQLLPSIASLRYLILPSPSLETAMRSAVASVDAVVARLPSEIGLLAIKHARRLQKPYAVEVVGCAWDGYWNHGETNARLYAPLAYLRTSRAIGTAPLALYVTSSWLQGRYPPGGRSGSASNVELRPFEVSAEQRREQRLAALAAGERPVLGTIASLHVRYKGVQTALHALAKLKSAGVDLVYRVLGVGPAEPWQELASKLGVRGLVHFDGSRSAGEDVCNWLDQIDIYLQPSLQEGLPRALIEAMSRGAACAGSTCGGIPELLPQERLHRPGDAAALERIIGWLAEHPGAVAGASLADREMARQFDAATLKSRRSQFYAGLRREVEKRRSAAAD